MDIRIGIQRPTVNSEIMLVDPVGLELTLHLVKTCLSLLKSDEGIGLIFFLRRKIFTPLDL